VQRAAFTIPSLLFDFPLKGFSLRDAAQTFQRFVD
jgi:hypothetical protein